MSSQINATNQWALFLGSTAMAFSPMAFVFGWIVYPKPPLMIVMTSYALAYVLSATCSSIVYTILNAIFQFNHNSNGISSNSNNNNNDALYSDYGNIFSSDGVLAAILPSIFFQFIFRCIFTSLYHNVERVIQISIQRHHQQQQQQEEEEAAVEHPTTHQNHQNQNGTVDSVVGSTNHHTNSNDDDDPTHTHHQPTTTQSNRIDIAKFTLTLNDGSAAIAAAIGFGGMHALTLYGTLLSSEAVHNTTGMLYQNSCPAVPSLVVSAMVTQLFTMLQIFWMLFTFFGMRRRLLFHRGGGGDNNDAEETPEMVSVDDENENDHRTNRRNHRTSGRWLGNRRSGGNYALLLVLLTHTAAAGVTLFHRRTNGCTIVLPTLLGIVLLTAYLFYSSCGRIYLPTTTMMMSTSTTSRQSRQRSTSD